MSSKAEFSQVMETEFRSLFASFHAKKEDKGGNSSKQQAKTSSTSISVEGGDQEIASMISDVNSPTIKNEIKQWLSSIRTFPKPFKFMVGPITELLNFNPSSLFTVEERDWGCEAHTADMKKDAETGERYYEIKVDGNITRKKCPYKDRDDLVYVIDRRLKGLERAIGVYMEEVSSLKQKFIMLLSFCLEIKREIAVLRRDSKQKNLKFWCNFNITLNIR